MKNTILKVLSVVLILTLALTAVLGLTGCNEDIKEDIAKNETGLKEANDALKTANAAIAKLQADLEKLNGTSATRNDILSDAVTALQNNITENEAALAELNTALADQATASANALDAKVAELQAKITEEKQTLETLVGTEKAALQAKIDANTATVAALQEAAAALRNDVDAAATQEALDAAIATLNEADAGLQSQIDELKTASDAGATQEELDEAVASLNETIASLNEAIAALQDASATKADLETAKNALQAQITANATDLANAIADIATLTAAIETAKTDLGNSISNVQAALEALDETYAKDDELASEINTLKNGVIADLQAAVTALQTVGATSDQLTAAVDALREELKPLIDEFGDSYNNATDILNGEVLIDGEEYSIDAFYALYKEKSPTDFTEEVFEAYNQFYRIQEFKLSRALTEQQILDIFGALKAYQDPENMKSILDVFKELVATVKANGITVAQAKDGELRASDYGAEDANAPVADGMGIDEFFAHNYNGLTIADREGYINDEDGVKTDYEAICAARDNLYNAEVDAVDAAEEAVTRELYAKEDGVYSANEVLYYPGAVDVNIDDVKALYDAIEDTYFADAEMNVFYADDVLDELTGYTFNVEQQAAWNHLADAKDALDDEIAEKFETIPVINEWPLYSDFEGIEADIAVVDAWAAAQEIEVDSKNYQLILSASLDANGLAPKDYEFVKHVEVYSASMKAIYNNLVLGVTFGEDEDAKNLAEQVAVEIEGGAENVLFVRIPVLYNIDDAIGDLYTAIEAVDGYSPYHEEVIQIEKDEYDELYAAIEWPAGLKYLQVEDKGTPETEDDEYFKVVEVIDDKNFDTMLGMADDKWAIYDDIRAKVGTLERAKYGDPGALEALYINGIDGLTEVLAAKITHVSYSDGAKITTGYQADLNAIFEYHGIMYAEESETDINYVNYVAMTTEFAADLAALKEEYEDLTNKVQAIYNEVAAIVKNAGTGSLTDLQKILWANAKVDALTGVDTPDFQLKEVEIEDGEVKKDVNGAVVYAKDAIGEQIYLPYTDFSSQLTAKLLFLVDLAEDADSWTINADLEALGVYDLNKTDDYRWVLQDVIEWLETYLGMDVMDYLGENAPEYPAEPVAEDYDDEIEFAADHDDWEYVLVPDYYVALNDYLYFDMEDYLPDMLAAASVYFIEADEKGDNQGILGITDYNKKTVDYVFIADFDLVIGSTNSMIETFAAAKTEWDAILDDVAALPALGDIHIHDVEIADASERYAAYVEAYYDGAIVNEQFGELTTYAELSDKQAELDLKIDEAATLYEDILREAQEVKEIAAGVPYEGDVITILAKVDDLLFHISEYRDLYCDGKHELCEKQCTLIGIAQYELPYDLEAEKAALEDFYGVDDLSDDAEPNEADYATPAEYSTAWTAWNNANTAYKNRVAENEFIAGYNEELVAAGDIDAELIAYQAKAKALAVKMFADDMNKDIIEDYEGIDYNLPDNPNGKITLKTKICSKIDAKTNMVNPVTEEPATTAEKIQAVKDAYNLFIGEILDVEGKGADPADYAIDPVLVP